MNSASKAVEATHSAPSKAASQQPRTVAKQESFSERKARYDRERAAKQAADAEKAEAAKQAALAAADASPPRPQRLPLPSRLLQHLLPTSPHLPKQGE